MDESNYYNCDRESCSHFSFPSRQKLDRHYKKEHPSQDSSKEMEKGNTKRSFILNCDLCAKDFKSHRAFSGHKHQDLVLTPHHTSQLFKEPRYYVKGVWSRRRTDGRCTCVRCLSVVPVSASKSKSKSKSKKKKVLLKAESQLPNQDTAPQKPYYKSYAENRAFSVTVTI